MLFSEKRDNYYAKIYRSNEEEYNLYQKSLFFRKKIPYAKDFDKENRKKIKDLKLYYQILNEVQKEEDKVTYLITFTNTEKESSFNKILSSFNKSLHNLKNLKSFDSLQFMYFSIIEPTRKGIPHLHIKLVVTKTKGFRTKLGTIVSKLSNSFCSIKKQSNSDKKAYLTKVLTDDKYKQYLMWLEENNYMFSSSVKRSRYIKINSNIKITLRDYKRVLHKLISRQKKEDSKYISLKDVKKYLSENICVKNVPKRPSVKALLKEINFESEQRVYSIINQVIFYINRFHRNKSPPLFIQKV